MDIASLWEHSTFEPNTGCWISLHPWSVIGLPYARYGHRGLQVHRLSWQLHYGPIPHGMTVLHKCDVAPCWNPQHLFLGNQSENMKDAVRKGRVKIPSNGYALKTHCKRGHPFDEKNTYRNPALQPGRTCRACDRMHQRNYYARRKATHGL
jgi:hypothetical protein